MAVMERDRWTDERVDERFDRLDTDIRELRTEMKEGFERVNKQFERVDDKFDAAQRNVTTWAIALFSTIVGLNVAVIAAIALT